MWQILRKRNLRIKLLVPVTIIMAASILCLTLTVVSVQHHLLDNMINLRCVSLTILVIVLLDS